MKRIYEDIIKEHLAEHEQMLFLAGPRQVGKSTICFRAEALTNNFVYLNWDNSEHRKIILQGEKAILPMLDLTKLSATKPILVLDEIHKFKGWKNYLKGFYDLYKSKVHIIVSGSAKLDIYRRGGDSLMGRYLLYRIHPLSLKEIIDPTLQLTPINLPIPHDTTLLNKLLQNGGYPDPYMKNKPRFTNQWRQLRLQQLFREDIPVLEKILNLGQLEVLAEILREQSGGLMNYTSLASDVRVSMDTIKRWIDVLSSFYYCFRLQPWHKNVKRSLLKEPKIYLWDWGLVHNPGARIENMVASHLLKAVNLWTDLGLGTYGLYYLRDKDKREVDFLVTRDNTPWFIVEVKSSDNKHISKNLEYFSQQLNVTHAFEVVFDLPFVNKDCFAEEAPTRVPLSTFLTQLC